MKTTQRVWSSFQSDCKSSNDSSMFRNEWLNEEFDDFDLGSSAFRYNTSTNQSKVHVTFNDSLDVCNYRIIQNYAVNKRENLNWDFLDESIEFLKCDDSIIKLEDSLDICNYRKLSQQTQTEEMETHEPVAETSPDGAINTSKNGYLNKTYDLCAKEEEDHALSSKLDDSIHVYKYRCSSSQPKTPARCDHFTARYFDKCVVPLALFETSSPVYNQS